MSPPRLRDTTEPWQSDRDARTKKEKRTPTNFCYEVCFCAKRFTRSQTPLQEAHKFLDCRIHSIRPTRAQTKQQPLSSSLTRPSTQHQAPSTMMMSLLLKPSPANLARKALTQGRFQARHSSLISTAVHPAAAGVSPTTTISLVYAAFMGIVFGQVVSETTTAATRKLRT
jgi:hypothetical protein